MKKVNILEIARMKEERRKIVMITAYDALFAKIFDEVGVDIILVGDSLGQVVLGLPNTLGVTMEDMERHTGAAARGRKWAYLIADMPFLSFQADASEAIRNAGGSSRRARRRSSWRGAATSRRRSGRSPGATSR